MIDAGRICYESAAGVAEEARIKRVAAWAAEMEGLRPERAFELAKQFDQSIEFDVYLSDEERSDAFHAIEPHLRLVRIRRLADLPERLPVFPSASRDVIQLAWDKDITLEELEGCAKCDPVIAGTVVAAANSGLFGGASRISDLHLALARLGTDFGRNVLLAAALRGAFSHPRYKPLWRHSLDSAETAAQLAEKSGTVHSSEAFLCGLVHDIGRLALLLAPREAIARVDRLREAGCPLTAVERAVFGTSHDVLGAEILDVWQFDQRLQDAVRCHHSPEHAQSPYASLVYAVEFHTQSEEDLPSLARLNAACALLGIDLSALTGRSLNTNRTFQTLAG